MQRAQAQEEQKQMMREQKKSAMQQLLSPEAYERLGNIAAVKPDQAERLENIIIQNASRGVIQGKVSDAQLIDLLNQVSEADAKNVQVERAKHRFDEEDDLDIDNLDI